MASNLPRPDHVVLNSTRARQGRYGRPVLLVLLASTALAALALFAAWTWRAPDLAGAERHNASPQAAAAFDAGPPAPQTRQRPAGSGAADSHPPGSTR